MIRGFITAARLLTILPVPGKESEKMSSSLPWFPVVGCMLGTILYGLTFLVFPFTGQSWAAGTAFLIILVGTVLTGGLHLDGLADSADALGCVRNRDRMLAVMKDSHTGVFGVVALILILLGKWVALSELIRTNMVVLIPISYTISRTVMVNLAVHLSYARSEGGTGASLVRNARIYHEIIAVLLCGCCVFYIAGISGIMYMALGLFVAMMFGLWCKVKLGGVTGDLLGACSELVETALLFTCAAWGEIISSFSEWNGLL